MIEDLFRESGLAEVLIEEGKQEGRQEGRQEGEEKGKQEGARLMAQVALEGQFGPLGEELAAAVQRADVPTLQDMVAHLPTESLEQVRARLGL
jgi:predicted transposase YdaD